VHRFWPEREMEAWDYDEEVSAAHPVARRGG
jgi:hypothetical protein